MTLLAPHSTGNTRFIKALLITAGLVAALALLPAPGHGQATARYGNVALDTPWDLSADRIAAQHDAEIIEAWGNVLLEKDGRTLRADYARYYWATEWVYLKDNVEAKWEGDYLTAEEAEFDLRHLVGWLKNGQVFVASPHLYFSGELIRKTGVDSYHFKDARITACDQTPAPWSFEVAEGEITIDGYAKLWHSTLNTYEHSVLYTPFMVLPVKTKRQSGLLLPEVSYSSRHGFTYNQPIYHVLDETADMTLYENYMGKHGLMQGFEYRYAPDVATRLFFRADYLYDKRSADTEADEDDQFDEDGLTRPNQNRYWVRGMYNGRLADPDWKVKANLDYVSDQNYLREFGGGYSGYEKSRRAMLGQFGRDIATDDSLTRTSSALVERSFDAWGLAARVDYTQNLAYMNSNLPDDKDPTPQHMPRLNAYIYKDRVGDTPFEFEADTEFTHFTRAYGATGTRVDLHPQVSLPVKTNMCTLIPRVGLRETIYAVKDEDEGAGGDDRDDVASRFVPDLNVSLTSDYYRVYEVDNARAPMLSAENVGQAKWTKIKHDVRPRVEYDYIPFVSQSDNPEFDEIDRLLPQNELTYSLTNTLTRRRDTVIVPGGESDQQFAYKADYLDFLIMRLEQGFDFREATRTEDRDEYPRRPFSDVRLDLIIRPRTYLSLVNKTWFSPYLTRITEHEHMLEFYIPDPKSRVFFGLDFMAEVDEYKRQDRDGLNMLHVGGELEFFDGWSAYMDYRADLDFERDLEKIYALSYDHQCYQVDFIFSQTPHEDRFEIRLNLFNLGFLGGEE